MHGHASMSKSYTKCDQRLRLSFGVQTCKVKRGAKDKVLRDAIAASDNLKNKLEEEFKENQKITANLVGSEQKLNGLRGRLSKIDPMDNKSIKSLYDEAVNIKNSLTPELNSVSQKSPGLFLFH